MTERDLFLSALDLPPADRPAYLDRACGHDPALRRRVDGLLAAHAAAGSFLENPGTAGVPPALDITSDLPPDPPTGSFGDPTPTAAHHPAEDVGTRIGPYRLLQKLGEGGMGTVWVAEQTEPVKRRVALKVIKPGMDSARVVARFEAERQALALMDHTNIAKVFDGGVIGPHPLSPSPAGGGGTGRPGSGLPPPLPVGEGAGGWGFRGRPYFVMELVKGVPITAYCDELHLSIRDRLGLFVQVCAAVQHAHQKGVIHRDLKPSNVLVAVQDGRPVPKVIDFGVAKAVGARLTDETMYTELGAVIGTLEYMAPEQAELSALDVDTRADVYALGVLLFELLTGTTPLTRSRLKAAGLAAMLRAIKEEEPPKPSTRLTESKESLAGLAAARRTDPRRLAREVRGELDWIVLKALEKDRTRRYDTANGLARDVERFLADEPVEAGPPSGWYRVRKFARRNRGPVLAAGLVAAALLLGIAGTTWGLVRADRARAAAAERAEGERRAKEEAQQAADAERAAKQAEADQRRVAEAVKRFLLRDLLKLADPSAQHLAKVEVKPDLTVRELALRAAAGLDGQFADQPLVEAEVRATVGQVLAAVGAAREAVPHLERARSLYAAAGGEDRLALLDCELALGSAYTRLGDTERAGAVLDAALARIPTAGLPPELAQLFETSAGMRKALRDRGGPADPGAERPPWPVGPDVTPKKFLGGLSDMLGRVEREAAGAGDEWTRDTAAANREMLAAAADGDIDRADRAFVKVLALFEAKLGPDAPAVLDLASGHAKMLLLFGRAGRAVPLLERCYAAQRTKLGAAHPGTVQTGQRLGKAYLATDNPQKAAGVLAECLAVCRKNLGDTADDTRDIRLNLAEAHLEAGSPTEAIPLYEAELAWRKSAPGRFDPDDTAWRLAAAYYRAGRGEKVPPLVAEAVAAGRKRAGAGTPALAAVLGNAGFVLL
ncbi:MAG: serine/threonine-protein kinase, partial [Gemmataceae bacterium]|nr:serine/threonine-protein kinase [Gemmataceae bacterium]